MWLSTDECKIGMLEASLKKFVKFQGHMFSGSGLVPIIDSDLAIFLLFFFQDGNEGSTGK